MLSVAFVALLQLCAAASLPARKRQDFGPLRFDDDGTFQLSIFEDLHFGESESYFSRRIDKPEEELM